MVPEVTEPAPAAEPEESGVIPSQTTPPEGAASLVPISHADPKDALGQSQFAAAVREIGSAFRSVAPQILLSRWGEDLHRRMDRLEGDLRATREQLTVVREDRAGLQERLTALGERSAAQDLLKVLGGAVLGLGLTLTLLSDRYLLGGIVVIFGALLAYFGGASIPRLRRNG